MMKTICQKIGEFVGIVVGKFKIIISHLFAIKTELPMPVGVLPVVPEEPIPITSPKSAIIPIKPPTVVDKKVECIKSLKIVVIDKFDPLIVYTQAYHETSNFTKIIGEWNMFGMKPPKAINPPLPGWDGKVVNVFAHEWTVPMNITFDNYTKLVLKEDIEDVRISTTKYKPQNLTPDMFPCVLQLYIKIKQDFCDFESSDKQMEFYIFQIKRLFKDSYENRQSPTAYYYWLMKGKNKYATDFSYSDKLQKLYADLRANGESEKMLKILNNI